MVTGINDTIFTADCKLIGLYLSWNKRNRSQVGQRNISEDKLRVDEMEECRL